MHSSRNGYRVIKALSVVCCSWLCSKIFPFPEGTWRGLFHFEYGHFLLVNTMNVRLAFPKNRKLFHDALRWHKSFNEDVQVGGDFAL